MAHCGTKDIMTAEPSQDEHVSRAEILGQRDSLFFDVNFSPSIATLSRSADLKSAYRQVEWVRLANLSAEATQGSTRIGVLGRPWFTAALAACENLISDFIIGDSSGDSGAFAVKVVNAQGGEDEVIVDDQVPCIDGVPVFTVPGEGTRAKYILMVEKAYAKLYGGYEMLLNSRWSPAKVEQAGPPTSATDRCIRQAANHAASALHSLACSPLGSLIAGETTEMATLASHFANAERPAQQENYESVLNGTESITTVGMATSVANPAYQVTVREDCHICVEANQSEGKESLDGSIAIFSDTGAAWAHVGAEHCSNSSTCVFKSAVNVAGSPYLVVPSLGLSSYQLDITSTKECAVKPLLPVKPPAAKGGWFRR